MLDRLDSGEAEAIILAKEIQAELLLIDERKGRNEARRFGIKIIGLLGVLVSAKRNGFIDEVKPLLDTLVNQIGFRVSKTLYERVLQEVDEN